MGVNFGIFFSNFNGRLNNKKCAKNVGLENVVEKNKSLIN